MTNITAFDCASKNATAIPELVDKIDVVREALSANPLVGSVNILTDAADSFQLWLGAEDTDEVRAAVDAAFAEAGLADINVELSR